MNETEEIYIPPEKRQKIIKIVLGIMKNGIPKDYQLIRQHI